MGGGEVPSTCPRTNPRPYIPKLQRLATRIGRRWFGRVGESGEKHAFPSRGSRCLVPSPCILRIGTWGNPPPDHQSKPATPHPGKETSPGRTRGGVARG